MQYSDDKVSPLSSPNSSIPLLFLTCKPNHNDRFQPKIDNQTRLEEKISYKNHLYSQMIMYIFKTITWTIGFCCFYRRLWFHLVLLILFWFSLLNSEKWPSTITFSLNTDIVSGARHNTNSTISSN